MQRRSTTQQALLGLNLTAVGFVAGLVLSGEADNELLLVLPIISAVLGLLWLDHALNIEAIGLYVREKLWIWEPSWEIEVCRQKERRRWRLVEFVIPIGATFLGPPLVALLITLCELGDAAEIAVWALSLAFFAILLRSWVVFMKPRWREEQRPS